MGTSFNHRLEKLSTGNTYHFIDESPPNPIETLLCVHGFPDGWYGWKNQIPAWTNLGYRVLVPDMLGYGETDKPSDLSKYTTKSLTADLAALLDAVGVEKAVIIGHDWGSFIAGRFALWQPSRLKLLVMMSVPFTPPSMKFSSMETVVQRAPNFGYQLWFSRPESTAAIEQNLDLFLRMIFQDVSKGGCLDFTTYGAIQAAFKDPTSTPQKAVISNEDMEYYKTSFSQGGVPLAYYRTSELRANEENAASLTANFKELPSSLAVLYLGGSLDPTSRPSSVQTMAKFVPTLETVYIENAGHWLMIEAKDEVTKRIASFIKRHLESSKL
ncbi:Alpha/Beta hydrolase protein [Flagelloscypha sp. PMI_526]|nr:Alpha/Beta hydrolase protein [Flagelloscypha sp. PMI_526]